MRYVMMRETGPGKNGIVPYFSVYREGGPLFCHVIGEKNPFTGKLALMSPQGRELGRVLRVGTPMLSYHTIWEAERRRAVLIRNLAAPANPYRLYSAGWRFRGDCFSGSFDLVDGAGRVVMTHGLCWKCGREQACLEIAPGEDALCLCIAAVVDSTPRTPPAPRAVGAN